MNRDRCAAIRASFYLPSLFEGLRRVGEDKFRGPCPLHGGDNISGFGVDKYHGDWRWTCFTGSCGSGSSIDAWLLLNDGRSFADAVDALSSDAPDSESFARGRAGERLGSTPAGALVLICDACRNETAEVSPRQYGNGKSRPYHTTAALQEAGALGWEIAGSVNACVGPKCLKRIASQ